MLASVWMLESALVTVGGNKIHVKICGCIINIQKIMSGTILVICIVMT